MPASSSKAGSRDAHQRGSPSSPQVARLALCQSKIRKLTGTPTRTAVTMPRTKNSAACDTCRRRKVKCDEALPICAQCKKSGRYCRRTAPSANSPPNHSPKETIEGKVLRYPFPSNPKEALQNQTIAAYFYRYMSGPASWYDLCDPVAHFTTVVPRLALKDELLFSAVIAIAAVQVSRTSIKSAREAAEFYHGHCVRLLIGLREDNESLISGNALAAACLLRSYEILHEEVDPNRHLQGAFSLASRHSAVARPSHNGLLAAGFWNYLREDITFSLFEGCILKMDLSKIAAPRFRPGESHLHSISLILGRIINSAFGGAMTELTWKNHASEVLEWHNSLPEALYPYSSSNGPGDVLPQVWFLQDFHASAMHYFYVATSILVVFIPATNQDVVLGSADWNPDRQPTLERLLGYYGLQICGIAFTANLPSVLVNAYGPISYCAKFIGDAAAQDEIIRHLAASKKAVGWPVERLMGSLQLYWTAAED